MVSRGEIWLATLDPTVGSEIRKTRPCLVVSPDDLNDHLRTVLVAPMTSGSTPARFRVAIAFQGTSGLVLPEQSRALDKRRLVKRLGRIDDGALAAVLEVLRSLFAE
jgi:mRNA interferase MazF